MTAEERLIKYGSWRPLTRDSINYTRIITPNGEKNADRMKRVPTCVFLLALLLVHYAHCQRPLSAANQTTALQPVAVPSPRGSSPNRANRFNATSTLGAVGGFAGAKGPGNKISNEDLSNKNRNRILKQNRLKPPQRGGGDESEDEVPIGLPPPSWTAPFDVNGAELETPSPAPVEPHNFNRGGGGGVGGAAGSVNGALFPSATGAGSAAPDGIRGAEHVPGYSRPSNADRKSSKNKYIELMGAGPPSQFPQGNVNRNPSSSQRQRSKTNKFQELRNMTRQSTANLLGRYGKQEPPRMDSGAGSYHRINYEPNEHINLLPVKSNQAMQPNLGLEPVDMGEAEERDDVLTHTTGVVGGGGDYLGNDSFTHDPDTYHPKYLEHHEVEDGDQLAWATKNNETGNTRDPLKKIKSRFNMDNVRNLPRADECVCGF